MPEPSSSRTTTRSLENPPTSEDVLRLARKKLISCERIEMKALAAELGTSRVTVHRWVGTRDQLMGAVFWRLAERTLHTARDETESTGGEGIGETMERFLAVIFDAPFMQAFMAREPEIGLRILTTKSSDFQARLVGAVERMLVEEIDEHRIDPPMGIHDLAFVTVRLAETFCWADLITGDDRDLGKVRLAISALLR